MNKKLNKKATSIVEVMVVLLIVTSGVVGMYSIFTESTKLSNSVGNKIQAIQIAREGIEAVNNIRDTNWLLFSGDYSNCWNTLNYSLNSSFCIGDTTIDYDMGNGSYKIYKDSFNRWLLEKPATVTTFLYSDSDYRDYYKVGLTGNGFYTQTGAVNSLKPLFTREIKIEYTEDTNGDLSIDSNDEKMKISSLVMWSDSSGQNIHKVELETVLSNWKNKTN